MSLQDTFLGQKKGAAQLVHSLFGQDGAELAAILERELGDQARFDHRELASADVDALWQALPSIASLVSQGSPDDLDGLKASSYAFRLMSFAQSLNRLPAGARSTFETILGDFGLGMLEVENYVNDFVK
jgi:hypothetical protein